MMATLPLLSTYLLNNMELIDAIWYGVYPNQALHYTTPKDPWTLLTCYIVGGWIKAATNNTHIAQCCRGSEYAICQTPQDSVSSLAWLSCFWWMKQWTWTACSACQVSLMHILLGLSLRAEHCLVQHKWTKVNWLWCSYKEEVCNYGAASAFCWLFALAISAGSGKGIASAKSLPEQATGTTILQKWQQTM